jgi:hypothetical protein
MKYVIFLFLGSVTFYGCSPTSEKVMCFDGEVGYGAYKGKAVGFCTCNTNLCNNASIDASGMFLTLAAFLFIKFF